MKRLVILLFLLIPALHFAQDYQFQFQRLDENKGWSKPLVYKIYEDEAGFIWAATNSGLIKFDGYETTIFSHNPWDSTSIRSNVVINVNYYKPGILWVSTNNGVSLLDVATEKFSSVSENPSSTLNTNYSYELFIDSQNRYWYLSSEGAALFNDEDATLTQLPFYKGDT